VSTTQYSHIVALIQLKKLAVRRLSTAKVGQTSFEFG
jgi:hypothetical protein